MNRFTTMTFDVHQHLWPAPFLAALRARTTPPRMVGWTLELANGDTFAIDPADHDPDRRAVAGPDVIAIAASAALGLDDELAVAWHDAALALGPPFKVWATGTDPQELQRALDHGAIGLELAADRLSAPGSFERLAPVLETLKDRPLLVHPGPFSGGGRGEWWAPVVPYVAQLHAAWWAWADGGRERFPELPVVFAALAGLGPLHGERFRARGGRSVPIDPLTFVETSTYGTQAVDAVIRVLGIDVVCHGSDAPYATPAPLSFDDAARHAIRTVNPQRLFAPQEVLA